MFSRWGWTDADTHGFDGMPGGRYVAGTTPTPEGPVRVIGVCIPWQMAHVSTGRKDRSPWEDHLAYLTGLGRIIAQTDGHLVVAGDFNQRLIGGQAPKRVQAALLQALGPLTVGTADPPPGLDQAPIDHVAHDSGWTAAKIIGISRADKEGNISDHDGVMVDLRVRVGRSPTLATQDETRTGGLPPPR